MERNDILARIQEVFRDECGQVALYNKADHEGQGGCASTQDAPENSLPECRRVLCKAQRAQDEDRLHGCNVEFD